MILSSPVKDFFVKAVPHAKNKRMQELNFLEAELIMAEEEILQRKEALSPEELNLFDTKIHDLKKWVERKKHEL